MPRSEKLHFTPEVAIEILIHLGYEVTTEKDYTRVKGEGVYNIPVHIYGPTWSIPSIVNNIFESQFKKGILEGRKNLADDMKKLLYIS